MRKLVFRSSDNLRAIVNDLRQLEHEEYSDNRFVFGPGIINHQRTISWELKRVRKNPKVSRMIRG